MTTQQPQTDSCPECSALVTDLARHTTWHAQVAQTTPSGTPTTDRGDDPDPGERIIGNMR